MSLLAPVYNGLNALLGRLTQALAEQIAANLDAAVSSRAPAATALNSAHYSAARAALLEALDATVSSRAPASTALSTADYSAARAAKLDLLDQAISAGLKVKPAQRGYVAMSGSSGTGNITITAVDLSKARLVANGKDIAFRLTSSTNIYYAADPYGEGQWEILEFE